MAQNIQQQLLSQDQGKEDDQPIELSETRDTTTQVGDRKPQANGNPNCHHLWRRSIDGCSGLPGVPCCADRNARWLVAQHGGEILVLKSIIITTIIFSHFVSCFVKA